jgi:hypothetical protein
MSSNALKESYDLSVQNYYTLNINCVTADSASLTQLLVRNVTKPFPPVPIIKNRVDRSGTETIQNIVKKCRSAGVGLGGCNIHTARGTLTIRAFTAPRRLRIV